MEKPPNEHLMIEYTWKPVQFPNKEVVIAFPVVKVYGPKPIAYTVDKKPVYEAYLFHEN